MPRNDALNAAAADDKIVAVALWYNRLRAETNRTFFPLFFNESRFLVLMGGAGSGKSIFAGRKVIERCLSEAKHRCLVCRKVKTTIRESCYEQLISQCADVCPGEYKARDTDMKITFRNGSTIIFAGLDDVEKMKSVYRINSMWIEEASELDEGDLNQLDMRLREECAYYQQIIITFNPVSITHWLKRRFFDLPGDNVTTHRSTYRDNRFLPDSYRATLESYREIDPYYYTVYCLGEWGVTGATVFDGQAVSRRLLDDVQPVAVGSFDGDRFVEASDGVVKIYKMPEKGVPYVIGGDTAGDGSDMFVAQVLDNRDGSQVAILRHRYDEDVYAAQVYALGMMYNAALIAVECNYSTYPVMTLERMKYPSQYVRESVDEYTHKPRKSFGFITTSKTRPVIISELVQAVRDDISIVVDRATLEEMLTFVRNEKYRPEAEAGAHDDCVMALAIAHYARRQQSYTVAAQEWEKTEWTRDMHEDYRAASPEEKAYLIKKWGRPKA